MANKPMSFYENEVRAVVVVSRVLSAFVPWIALKVRDDPSNPAVSIDP